MRAADLPGPVESAIRQKIMQGTQLLTPVQSEPFDVGLIDSQGVVLLLGKKKTPTKLSWPCLEGIPAFLAKRGRVRISGSGYSTEIQGNTLDGYLKGHVYRATAGWVASLLERAELVEIDRQPPATLWLANPTLASAKLSLDSDAVERPEENRRAISEKAPAFVVQSRSPVITAEDMLAGCREFEKHEKRDAMYKVATFLISHFWGKAADMADALGVLLLTWNQAFYRYGVFDFEKLEKCIAQNLDGLNSFREKEIASLTSSDEGDIRRLFEQLLEALQIDSGKKRGTQSPVAVAKTLHLLAPKFFPLWDDKIARAYGCYYGAGADPALKYICFCRIIRAIAATLQTNTLTSTKTLVKLIDEYNYSKFTQRWV